MTQDDIIRMAREAGGRQANYHKLYDHLLMSTDALERFFLAAAAAERERIKAERQPHLRTNGCPVCGLGSDGNAVWYCCSRGDCPTRVTCTGAV